MNIDYVLQLHCVSRKKSDGENPSIPEYYELATDDDFSGTTNGTFNYIGTKQYVIIPEVIKGINVTSYSKMFKGNSIVKGVQSYNTNVTSMYEMFYGCSSIISLDLSSFDTSKVTNMGWMFSNCSSLTSLGLSSFNTSNVINMSYMFSICSSLTSLDLSSFDTSNVAAMQSMFYGCSSITSLDLSSFDTSKVTEKANMLMNTRVVKTAYARTTSDATRLNTGTDKPTTYSFVVKP